MKVSEIAELLRGNPAGDAGREIQGVAALETAGPTELAYVEGPRALDQAAASRAGCLLVPEGVSLPGHTTIAVPHPKLALIRAAEALHPASISSARDSSHGGGRARTHNWLRTVRWARTW